MKKIKLFSAIGLLTFLSIAVDFNHQKSDILGDSHIQMVAVQELSTPRALPHLRIAKSITQKLESKKNKTTGVFDLFRFNTTKGGKE